MSFAHDDQYVISRVISSGGGEVFDGQILIWEVTSGNCLYTFMPNKVPDVVKNIYCKYQNDSFERSMLNELVEPGSSRTSVVVSGNFAASNRGFNLYRLQNIPCRR